MRDLDMNIALHRRKSSSGGCFIPHPSLTGGHKRDEKGYVSEQENIGSTFGLKSIRSLFYRHMDTQIHRKSHCRAPLILLYE